MAFLDHDLKPGAIDRCQVCGSSALELVIDLGHQPLCDSLLSKADLDKPEKSFPLRQVWCRECSLNQIDYVVPREEVFHREYPYRSGITKELATYQAAIAAEFQQRFGLEPSDLVVDLGSNDGTLLKGFKDLGFRVLGVEPTDIARIAREENEITTIQGFFDEKLALSARQEFGQAKVITSTNVFAHVSQLGEFMRGVQELLDDQGIVMIENHYLLQVMRTGQFDTIYHEHLRTYSLRSLVKLFDAYGLRVFSARQVDRYGGNIRIFASRSEEYRDDGTVAAILKDESELSNHAVYKQFAKRAEQVKLGLLEAAIAAKKAGRQFVGNSCPGRCSTLLNYCGIGTDLMPYLAEQATSLKLGLFLPGMHIPVVNNERLIREQPEEVVLLAWHYAQPIAEQLRARGLKSKLLVPFPQAHFI